MSTMALADLNFFQAIGLMGFAAYLAGFGALQMGWLDGNGRVYAWANIFGASFVLISLYDAFNLASALIQLSWILIGTVGLMRRASRPQEAVGRHQPAA